jgi:hypothetical protein
MHREHQQHGDELDSSDVDESWWDLRAFLKEQCAGTTARVCALFCV